MSLDASLTSSVAPPAFDSGGEVPSEYDVFCEGCGYSLVGIVADRCPECGRTYDPNDLPFARIPWLHRTRIGRWRAYWATVRMILFRPRQFALELCRPVRISAGDASLFRRRTLRIAMLSMLATVLPAVGNNLHLMWTMSGLTAEQVAVPLLITAVFAVAFGVFLTLATDMPLFIWKGLPSRPPTELAPIHHYASAPLALTPLLAVVILGALAVVRFAAATESIEFAAALAIGIATGLLVLLSWILPLILMWRATGCRAARVAALAAYLPVHWALIAAMSLLGFGVVMTILGSFIRGI